MFVNFACIALGGAVGSCLRFGVTLLLPASGRFVWATFIVNILGSFLIGVLLANVDRGDLKFFLGVVGFCGAFTTFSAFSAELFEMIRAGEWMLGVGYAILSVVVCVVAVAVGALVKINN